MVYATSNLLWEFISMIDKLSKYQGYEPVSDSTTAFEASGRQYTYYIDNLYHMLQYNYPATGLGKL